MITATIGNTGERRIPAEAGIWVLVISDMMVFAIIFSSFVYHRALSPGLYAASQRHLSIPLGLLNTIILLTGSLFVAGGVEAFRRQNSAASRRCLAVGIACGVLFCAVKFIEWKAKFSAGITPETNEFFQFYFMMTGIHLIHVCFASILLAIVRSWKVTASSSNGPLVAVEAGGIVWHLIDLIWILLFPLLYLTS